jgi:hypothetical protein
MGSQVTLVKGNRQVGFQVDQATHILWFWLKEVARWDLRLTEKKKRKKDRERKKEEKESEKEKSKVFR